MKRFYSPLALRLSAFLTLLVVASFLLVSRLTSFLDERTRQGLLAAYLVAAFGGGVLLALALDIVVTRPLRRLVEGVRLAVDRGWSRPIPVPEGRGELTELGQALEELRRSVLERRAELARLNAELEARVEERTEELRRAWEQLVRSEKLAALGRLAAGVAHEVNNPIGVIQARVGYLLQVADEEGLDPEVIEDLEVVEGQARRVAEIARRMLRFGRLGGGERGALDLGETAVQVVGLLAHEARRRAVRIRVDRPEAACTVHANASEIEQVVFNLLQNAILASPEGGEVELVVRPGRLAVRDAGPGVPPGEEDRIFEPFYTTRPVGEGTGMGLAVAYGIVSDHGGAIAVRRAPQGGAEFEVTLPREAPSEEAAVEGGTEPR